MTLKDAFALHLSSDNLEGSGRAASYLRSLELLETMLREKPEGFEDCRDIWCVGSVERLEELRQRVLVEAKQAKESVWEIDGLPRSYLRDGFCSAALTKLIEFLPMHIYAEATMAKIANYKGDADALANDLNKEPVIDVDYIDHIQKREGKDQHREMKMRIGQYAFRRMILSVYQNRCCITELDIPEVNRASHIIGWSERKDTRMDPRNGLCLSATYDAAFDKHLISFDEQFRLLVSKDISEHYTSASVKDYFIRKQGEIIRLPSSHKPSTEFMEIHRSKGRF